MSAKGIPGLTLARALLLILLGGSVLLASTAGAEPGDETVREVRTDGWIGSWAVAQYSPGPLARIAPQPAASEAGGLTIRNVVRTSIGGSHVRVRLSNRFGSRPVTFDRVRAAVSTAGAGTRIGTSRTVGFGGSRSVTVPVGTEVTSDPIRFPVRRGTDVAVSLHSSARTGRVTIGGTLGHRTFVSRRGDFTGSNRPDPFGRIATSWYFLSGVDVKTHAETGGAVVVVGDSIAEGAGSVFDVWDGWVDGLASRLARRHLPMSVLNSAINGNTLHESSPCFGQRGPARLRRDAFDQTGVSTVVLALGVNDLAQPGSSHSGPFGRCLADRNVSVGEMIGLYKSVVRRAHGRDLKMIGTTITPFRGFPGWSRNAEAKRVAINKWILNAGAFDEVIDFSEILEAPGDPSRLAARFDSGDGLHPNPTGHAAMAGVAARVVAATG